MILNELLLPIFVVLITLILGAGVVDYLHHATSALGKQMSLRRSLNPLAPLYRLGLALSQQSVITEHPDRLNLRLAPALYFALAALGLAVVPWSADFIPADLVTGMVLWGAVEVLATVVIFLCGWSANAHLPLLGAYRYVSLGLSYMLVSMFVLIGVALPAESLQLSAVVESQREIWNVLRQPMGLPLFLIVGLGLTFWGPLDFASSPDLDRGISADQSGASRLVWQLARYAMLVAFSFMAATVFLGGWLGPWLPGPLWLVLKATLVLLILLWMGHNLPVMTPDKFISVAWLLLLPLSFVDLIWAGALALW